MIQRLSLTAFKNFRQSTLHLGPFTLIVGANASGKSNLRDAFRFLHGVGRGYSLAEIIGEKYGEGGVLQWRGIRGGTREIAAFGAQQFGLEVTFSIPGKSDTQTMTYRIEVALQNQLPLVTSERLAVNDEYLFESEPVAPHDPAHIRVRVRKAGLGRTPTQTLSRHQTILAQCVDHPKVTSAVREQLQLGLDTLADMRFLDLNPQAMRQASFPGQLVLGDQGENLSAVLYAMCADPQRKETLRAWLRELTPMDAVDFAFPSDQIGRILVSLVEENGAQVSAYSASDGTLRFLGMLAALLGPKPARFYFFEELDNGLHPTRLHLLLQLIERQTKQGQLQVVASTHSPQVLRLASAETRQHITLTYRLADQADARIIRLRDIPEAQRVIDQHDLARLHESGWLEDAVTLMAEEAR
ncbi:hypothetical protein A6A03_01735 [Chloroflexus islandicus]|uniref:ATPase AAA-type core domain-containing protein n=1 Tax=Chloroflexus islandicus TaxID=1707952 RepID=A0A178MB69_9CHLR|nr:ATP-binding protein [Chloroflexus islandicus]OAN46002.1 hypothetical protein A6A03_01735 [Chloroflexus islandicus]